eukprot:m.730088 g.730088  ORF g.730088 m.730088 type:complete len:885 (+) comp23052_c2_seq4:343-2997(+)
MDNWKSSTWYHPELHKDNSKTLLQGRPKGTFMVTNEGTGYCLWICGEGTNSVYRFLLKRVGNDNRVQLGTKIFSSPASVIAAVSRTPLRYNDIVLALAVPYTSNSSDVVGAPIVAPRTNSNTLPSTRPKGNSNGAISMGADEFLVQLSQRGSESIGMKLESMQVQRPDGSASWRHCICALDQHGAAARAGILARDYVLEVNGKPTHSMPNATVLQSLVERSGRADVLVRRAQAVIGRSPSAHGNSSPQTKGSNANTLPRERYSTVGARGLVPDAALRTHGAKPSTTTAPEQRRLFGRLFRSSDKPAASGTTTPASLVLPPENSAHQAPVKQSDTDETIIKARIHRQRRPSLIAPSLKDRKAPHRSNAGADPAAEVVTLEADSTGGLSVFLAPVDIEAFKRLDYKVTNKLSIPPCARGKKYNRYWDILPNPITRVVLPPLAGLDPEDALETTYINANYIRGHGERSAKYYVAAQGPMASTINNFVRMIFHQGIRCVVMTTGFVERGVTKCEKYFPDSPDAPPLEFGDYSVTTKRVQRTSTYQMTTFVLKDLDTDETLRVEHMWYHAWPDHGVPTKGKGKIDPDGVLDFLQLVRSTRVSIDGCSTPMLVHCSAGVGRTGTFIAIDHVMDAIKDRDVVDLLEIIDTLRDDRTSLVQHPIQYKFAYQACVNYAKKHVAASDGGEIYALASSQPNPKGVDLGRDASWKQKKVSGQTVFAFNKNAPALVESKDEKHAEMEPTETPQQDSDSDSGGGDHTGAETQVFDPMLPLERQPWFRKNLLGAQVIELLEDAPVGTFIVRPSSRSGYFILIIAVGLQKVMEYLLIPVVSKEDGTTHFKLGSNGRQLYSSIVELIFSYVKKGKLLQAVDSGGHVVQMLTGDSSRHESVS